MSLSKTPFPPAGWEQHGGNQLFGLMEPFDSTPPGGRGRLYCPWLETWCQLHGPEKLPTEGILLMQDWGLAEPDGTARDAFEAAVELLLTCLAQGANSSAARLLGTDRTLRNLLPNPLDGWSNAFAQGRWLITNAVWGLRPPGSQKSGYLGRTIHAAALPVWQQLVVLAAWSNLCATATGRFTLIVAGEWGRFGPSATNPDNLPDYTDAWQRYAGIVAGRPVVPDARVLYTTHPSRWLPPRVHREMLAGPPCF